ncbi:MAG: transcriptional repressor [Pseudomonadota bacterium]
MDKVQEIIASAEQRCSERGVRLTTKRKRVLKGLVESENAMSAYELVDYCNRTYGDSMAPMSIYRILDFLESEHLAHKVNMANKYVACSHITCDHEHMVPQFLVCDSCSKVKEVGIPKAAIAVLEQSVQEAGYLLSSPQLEISCLCDECANDAAPETLHG